jgi:hypothetical protein
MIRRRRQGKKRQVNDQRRALLSSLVIRDIPKSTSEGIKSSNDNVRRYASIDGFTVGDDEDGIATSDGAIERSPRQPFALDKGKRRLPSPLPSPDLEILEVLKTPFEIANHNYFAVFEHPYHDFSC